MRFQSEDDRGVRKERKFGVERKKAYHSPRLISYGNLRQLTTAKGGTNPDGGASSKNPPA